MTVRFIFTPKARDKDKQCRLGIYILTKYNEKGLGDSVKILFEKGSLTNYYNPKNLDPSEVPSVEPQVACEIVRREDAVEPLHSREFNDRIPDYYYAISPFKSNMNNDFSDLDRVLDGIEEPVTLDVSIEPTDVAPELYEHGRYLSHLQSINRTWDHDHDDGLLQDYLGDEHGYAAKRESLKPLREPDPLAEDILRFRQRFHESLRQPHLLFHILIFAQTFAVARLIGSVVADSAFEEGSYRLLTWNKREKYFDNALQSVQEVQTSALPVHEYVFQDKDPNLYSRMARLSHLATVDELTGIFRLPVASISSPRCIRKNTDPPHEKDGNSIIFGYDQENPDLPRGPQLYALAKHLFGTGVPGVGKTTAMLNLALQLNQQEIPFLIIESAKTEYRVQKTFRNHPDQRARQLAEKIEVYTPGNENVSPFRYNPLKPLPGIFEDEHIDNTMACFQAAMPLFGPLPALLREALERVYENHPDVDNPPIMADLVEAAEQVLAEKGYSPETNSDIRAALEVRLGILTHGSIGRVFECRKSIPSIQHLMKVPAIIELDRAG